jgi:hypothetical protein
MTPNKESEAFNRRSVLLGGTALTVAAAVPSAQAQSPSSADNSLPMAGASFEGKIGDTYKTSTSDFPQPVTPPKGAPNIVVILLDDLGFAGTQA